MKNSVAMSLRGLAKRLKVSHAAVEKAVATGRLSRSVRRDPRGRPVIVDLAVARREWAANATKGKANGKAVPLVEAQRSLLQERAFSLRLRNQERAGRLVDAREVELSWSRMVTLCRNTILGTPTAFKARFPDITREQLVGLDALLRDALEALADADARGADDERGDGEERRRRSQAQRRRAEDRVHAGP